MWEYLNAINNVSACSVLFLSTPGLFPALRKTLEHSTASRALKLFCVLETAPAVLKNSTEHAKTLFIALIDNVVLLLNEMLLTKRNGRAENDSVLSFPVSPPLFEYKRKFLTAKCDYIIVEFLCSTELNF